MTKRLNGSTVGHTRADLEYEKTALLAALEHDQIAGDMTPVDRRSAREAVRNINAQLATWAAR